MRAPKRSEYVRAFKLLSPLPPRYLAMLQVHYRLPERTARAAQIGRGAGYEKNPTGSANLHYGRLARLVGVRLRWRRRRKLNLYVLVTFKKQGGHWHWTMREEVAQALRRMGWAEPDFEFLPGEMPEKTEFIEGAIHRVAVAAYERNPQAREACLKHYGRSCAVCGFDFETAYGEIAKGFIEVHHLRALAEISGEYVVDPMKDLRPICPNCHRVLHLRTPPYSIRELKAMIGQRSGFVVPPGRCISAGSDGVRATTSRNGWIRIRFPRQSASVILPRSGRRYDEDCGSHFRRRDSPA